MKERKKVYKQMVVEARALGLNILFSFVDLKKDPLILAKAKHKLGQLIVEYVEDQPRPYGAFITISLPKRFETPNSTEAEIEPIYISLGFHENPSSLFSTFLSDSEELVKLFTLEN